MRTTRLLPVIGHGPGDIGLACRRPPTYLRAIVTAKCPLACKFCHQEGDPASADGARGLPRDELVALICAGLQTGVRKVKLLGGDPLIRPDLVEVVGAIRAADATVDLSIITAGVFPSTRLDALFAAGLSRCNMSVHGWSVDALSERGGNARQHAMRAEFLERVLLHGRPVKLNYVIAADTNLDDLNSFLDWAAPHPVVVNVLDDLRGHMRFDGVFARIMALRGRPAESWTESDPHSLPTQHLRWADGLEVELKDQQLGVVAPWSACKGCAVRTRCREGIHAVRLSHQGVLRPCMDRDDLGLDLLPILRRGGTSAVVDAWLSALNLQEVAA